MSEAEKMAERLVLDVRTVDPREAHTLLEAATLIRRLQAENADLMEQLAIRSESGMATDMQEIMKANNALQAENKALRVKQGKLVEALKQVRDETRGCSQDMGFCRENGPLGCALGDQCVCMPVHMIARAAIEALH